MTTDEEIMESMLARSINPANDSLDKLSAEMFCMLVRNNNSLVHKSQEMILSKIRSNNTTEAINAIKLLKECMSRCGVEFQNEVAKFRFLNDLIRLVSNKYNGACTSKEVRQQIMDCLLLWTTEFPAKTKIREVYDMLMKEVAADGKASASAATNGHGGAENKSALGIDEKEFRRLLKSGDPEDLKRANLLIQHRVSQESRLAELNAQHRLVLQEVSNTVMVLNQMLDVYDAATEKPQDGSEEMNLIRELYMACKKHKPVMKGLGGMLETASENLMMDTVETNASLLEVLKRYKNIVVHHVTPGAEANAMAAATTTTGSANKTSDNYLEELLGIIPTNVVDTKILLPQTPIKVDSPQKSRAEDLHNITDMFNSLELNAQIKPGDLHDISALGSTSPLVPEKLHIPKCSGISTAPVAAKSFGNAIKVGSEKRELKEIDVLSEQLFRDLNKSKEVQKTEETELVLDDDNILMTYTDSIKQAENCAMKTIETEPNENIEISVDVEKKKPILKLAEIDVALEDIIPKSEERILLDDADIKITLTFTENRPSAQVSVIVISVFNKSKMSLKDFVFEASVKKPAKVRLLTPTSNELPPFHVFPPPTPINQVMLLLNTSEKPVDITCIVGYKLGDDPDPIKESLTATNVPYVQ